MVAVVFANLLAFRLLGRSMFDVVLARAGVDLSLGRDRALLEHTKIIRACPSMISFASISMTPRKWSLKSYNGVSVLKPWWSIQKASTRASYALLIYSGKIQTAFSEVLQVDSPVFNEDTTLWQGMSALEGFVGEAVPIVSATDRKLIGMIAESELITAYQKIARGLRSEENEAV